MKLKRDFYERENVVEIARDLVGKVLYSRIDGVITAGKIVEVEAYAGRNDRACHANEGLRTPRTEIMYGPGGCAYIYLCYGIHHLFNVVTNKAGKADAVLIRAIEPVEGLSWMQERRNMQKTGKVLTGGPGRMSQALGLHVRYDGTDLTKESIWIADEGLSVSDIVADPRIGVAYAEEDALKPWRFSELNNSFVSVTPQKKNNR